MSNVYLSWKLCGGEDIKSSQGYSCKFSDECVLGIYAWEFLADTKIIKVI